MAIDWTKIQKKYKGLWVALSSDEQTVLGSGKTVQEALAHAKRESDEIPYMTRMPEKITSYVGVI
ncbi:MAG TPA: DUF5678 domain-containing protein [Candidatus Paceibacterota bacterium]|nr:DUF5678 domain-containing protein [Candidatus Paceibacterota bacterium]